MQQIDIINITKATTVCAAGQLADTFSTRLRGLLGKQAIAPDSGLLIRPSTGVHTFGMRFAIDIVALNKQARVVGVWEGVGPWRIRGLGLQTHSVLELESGRAKHCGITVGDYLAVNPVAPADHED